MRLSFKIIISLFICSFIFQPSILHAEDQFDRFGGWKGLQGTKTGVFHTEEVNGRWWIITPEGHGFWSTGMYSVRMSGIPESDTKKRPYQEASLKKYGSEREWARVTRLRLREWGFNTIGDWSSEAVFREPGFAYVAGLDLPRTAANVIPKGAYGYFPDVFSPEFKSSVMAGMAERFKRQAYLLDDPWLLGYFLADEPSWYGSKQRRGALVDDFIAMDAGSPGKQRWVAFLKGQYPAVPQLNKAWGTKYKSFEELLTVQKINDTAPVKEDKLKFLKVIALEFSKTLVESLREFDKHHMVLGTRPTRQYPEVLEAIGQYTDIFGISAYDLNQGYKVASDYEEKIENIYRSTRKPILLGILIRGQDVGLPYGDVRTQRDRGISYWRYIAKVASDPRIVGAHWFQYFDPPRKCYDKMAANWGLVNDQDEPYTDAVELIKQANKMVYAYTLGLSDFAPQFDGAFGLMRQDTPAVAQGKLKRIAIPIANGDFEKKGRDWKLQAWKGNSKASFDSSVKHDGKYSLKVEGSAEGWDSVGVGVQYNPQFILKPGLEYILSVWIKTENVSDYAYARIRGKTKTGGDFDHTVQGVSGTEDWTRVEAKFTPLEENTVNYIAVQLVGKGTAWFDDVRLEVIASEEVSKENLIPEEKKKKIDFQTRPLALANPGFEDGKQGWNFQRWKGRPRIDIDQRMFHGGRRSVRIAGTAEGWDSTGVAVQNPDIELKSGRTYVLQGWIKTKDVEGSAFLRIKVKYADGGSEYAQTDDLGGTGDWEKVSKVFELKQDARIEYLTAQMVGKGTAWFDDISLEEKIK
jgi:agarase